MKTTIDIPDPLYRRVKIRAAEQGTSLKEIVLRGLHRELDGQSTSQTEPKKSFIERRKLRPGFRRLIENGGLGGGTDSTIIVSEDRSSRDEAIAQ